MMKLFGIALGAGVTSAALFAVITTASPAAVLLTYLAPLPIMIVALGFAHPAAAAAAVIGGGTVGVVLGWPPAIAFLVAIGLPAWYLAKLAQSGRTTNVSTASDSTPASVAWYPIPPLMLRVAALAVVPILLSGAVLMWQFGGYEHAVEILATRLSSLLGRDTWPGDVKATDIVRLLPVLVAISGASMLSVNLWLAGRTVQISNRLQRPWPNLPDALLMPRSAAAAFAIFAAAGFLPDPIALAATVLAASLGIVFVFEGLAMAHVLTRGLPARSAALTVIYLATAFLMPLSLFALALLGLIDCLFPQLRQGAEVTITILPKRKQ